MAKQKNHIKNYNTLANRQVTLKRGDICVVFRPDRETPDEPGGQLRPALIWDIFKDENDKIQTLNLLWMRTYNRPDQIDNGLTEYHYQVRGGLARQMGFGATELLFDLRDTITVPVMEEFFPSEIPDQKHYALSSDTPVLVFVKGNVPNKLLAKFNDIHNRYLKSGLANSGNKTKPGLKNF